MGITVITGNFFTQDFLYCRNQSTILFIFKVLSELVCLLVWHLIIGCHLCVASTLTSDNAEDLFQYDPGC